jgi:serine/threonine-protein kinase HipA
MTSKPSECFVWVWLPGATEPVVAGRLFYAAAWDVIAFNYGKSYLQRPDAIPLNLRELALTESVVPPPDGLKMPSAIRDGSPDAWGRRVIFNRLNSRIKGGMPDIELNELVYLLESGSDRIGAFDFQVSPTHYVPRLSKTATLDELQRAAELVEAGEPLSEELDKALNHGTSIGGARPKAVLESGEAKYVAKFSASTDSRNVVKAEFIAMRLAAAVGLNVAPVQLATALGKDVLIVERFDRSKVAGGWTRTIMTSALTLFGLDEMLARYCSYETLTDIIRTDFSEPKADLRELFARLVFNILCSNTDDHARNHAAFFDGKAYRLTPAYDICPQIRTGSEATQAMRIQGERSNSQLRLCLAVCAKFLLTQQQAIGLIRDQLLAIGKHWQRVCEEAAISPVDRAYLASNQFLHRYAFEDLPEQAADLAELANEVRRTLAA